MPRKNLLVMICHDLGDVLNCYGHDTVNSPNIDRLASKGVLLENYYCTAPTCSPSRASIWTGRYPHSTGMLGLIHGPLYWKLNSEEKHLAQYFKEKGVPVLGVEPSENVARVAIEKEIPTEKKFFGHDIAGELKSEYRPADLILGNNVLAHVPDINDFVSGLKVMLSEKGFMTFEFPHLMQLVENNQFDTIYHEHFSYFSLLVVGRIFAKHGLKLFHVEELKSHGGSIRIYICHQENDDRPVRDSVTNLLGLEEEKGYRDIALYTSFDEQVKKTKRDLLKLLIDLKENGKTIAGYGAPGKGNTLLNYCGIGKDFMEYTVDRNPNKHGMFLPGSLIPIYSPDKIRETQPDYVFILPWNLKKEIVNQISYIREWGGKFIIPIPEPEILD